MHRITFAPPVAGLVLLLFVAIVRLAAAAPPEIAPAAPATPKADAEKPAPPPPDPEREAKRAEIEALVDQFDLPEKARRDEAERKLLELGPAALHLVPEPHRRRSAEAKLRLARIRAALAKQAAEAMVRETRVTLNATAMPLEAVLEALHAQTGNRITLAKDRLPPDFVAPTLTLKLADVPFWTALDQVLDQSQTQIVASQTGNQFSLIPAQPGVQARAGRGSHSGAFRFEATEASAYRDLRGNSPHALQLQIEVAWEPRLQPVVLINEGQALFARDDRDQEVKFTPGAEGAVEVPVLQGAVTATLTLGLEAPPREARRLAVLRGTLTALAPTASATFRFEDLDKAKNTSQRQGQEQRRLGTADEAHL
jgi:hypothetical protein